MELSKNELKKLRMEERKAVTLPDVTILSNTCLGGRLYHDYHAEFKSPTIDLYISPGDFIKFCLDLDGYLNQKLKIIEKTSNIAKGFLPMQLGDIAIYFAHSNKSYEISKYNWEKRKERIIWNNIKCICTDRITVFKSLDNCGIETINDFEKIKYNKVFFSVLPVEKEYVSFLKSFSKDICCPEATRASPYVYGKYIVESDGFDLDKFLLE